MEKKSKRSKKTAKKAKGGQQQTGGGGGFQKMDKEAGMERMPSNAPTMAIAPSDYEHIFHEGNAATVNGERPSPPAAPAPAAPAVTTQAAPPLPPSPREIIQQPAHPAPVLAARTYPPNPMTLPSPNYSPPPTLPGGQPYGVEVPVTPDGYTMLGAPTLEAGNNRNRVALPPHIVRASNQFSRAALARVARYLASRADPARIA